MYRSERPDSNPCGRAARRSWRLSGGQPEAISAERSQHGGGYRSPAAGTKERRSRKGPSHCTKLTTDPWPTCGNGSKNANRFHSPFLTVAGIKDSENMHEFWNAESPRRLVRVIPLIQESRCKTVDRAYPSSPATVSRSSRIMARKPGSREGSSCTRAPNNRARER